LFLVIKSHYGTYYAIVPPLTNLQLELVKLFAKKVSEEDLKNIKFLIANYFAEKAMDKADEVWDDKGWTAEDAKRMLQTKLRTPYASK